MNNLSVFLEEGNDPSGLMEANFEDIPITSLFVYEGEFYKKTSVDIYVAYFRNHEEYDISWIGENPIFITARMAQLIEEGYFSNE